MELLLSGEENSRNYPD